MLGSSEIELLFSRLVFCEEREQDITEKIQRFLGSTSLLGGEASHASDILCQWRYEAAEHRERVTHADLIRRLAHVGRYLHARAGYWRDWVSVNKTIETLAEEEGICKAAFYSGRKVPPTEGRSLPDGDARPAGWRLADEVAADVETAARG